MAVVFISPKQRQKTFFLIITVAFLVLIGLLTVGVFSAKPAPAQAVLVFNKPKVNIDLSVLDTQEFQNLQPFSQMEIQYSYRGVAKDKSSKSGFIVATSIDQARAILTASGLTVTYLSEASVGRDNPFIPYYQTDVSAQSLTNTPAVSPSGNATTGGTTTTNTSSTNATTTNNSSTNNTAGSDATFSNNTQSQ